MRAKFANLNDCAVSFLSRAAANLCWYWYTLLFLPVNETAKTATASKMFGFTSTPIVIKSRIALVKDLIKNSSGGRIDYYNAI